ncbi:uncharacterized protein [Dysidea avara]
MICAAVTLSAIEDVEDQASVRYQDTDKYESAAGWLVFVSVMGMIYEPLVILLRFLNLEIFNQKFIYFMIAGCIDVGISVVFAISYFSGGVASAVYSNDIDSDDLDDCDSDICNDVKRVRDSEAASAAFSFFAMIAFGILAGIVILTILLTRKGQGNSDNKEDTTQ